MEILSNCPICDEKDSQTVLVCEDYTVTHEKFTISACLWCGFQFTNPRPEESKIGKYYESDSYVSHSNSKKGIINAIYHFVRQFSLNKKIQLINSLSKKGKLLDIGCGTGEFLSTSQKNGWNVRGIEPNEKARELAIVNYHLTIGTQEDLSELTKGSFDIITMWHVLEHVHLLNKRVGELHQLLSDSGKVIIAVPNCTSADAKHYGENWAAYDVPRHLYHFTPVSIKKLLAKHKFYHVASYPMKFDSYYVSMLTEKNVHHKNKLFSSFINGLKSNRQAKNDAEKYSSVIYVFAKV